MSQEANGRLMYERLESSGWVHVKTSSRLEVLTLARGEDMDLDMISVSLNETFEDITQVQSTSSSLEKNEGGNDREPVKTAKTLEEA